MGIHFDQRDPASGSGGVLYRNGQRLFVDGHEGWLCIWGEAQFPTFVVKDPRQPGAWHLKQFRSEAGAATAQKRHPEWNWQRIEP